MVIDRLGSDLQKVCERSGGRMKKATVLQLGQRLVRLVPPLHSRPAKMQAQRFCWRLAEVIDRVPDVWPTGERAGVHPWERVRPRRHQSCQPSAGLQEPWTGQTGLWDEHDVLVSYICIYTYIRFHYESVLQVYLADYGLSYRYCPAGVHKEYKECPKKGHNGTIEYTSLDAHRGLGETSTSS